jgi:hypothetical protein
MRDATGRPLPGQIQPNAQAPAVPGDVLLAFKDEALRQWGQPETIDLPFLAAHSPQTLGHLNRTFGAQRFDPIFPDFRRQRRRIEALALKTTATLTADERHLRTRLARAPKGAAIPRLDAVYRLRLTLPAGQTLTKALTAYRADPAVAFAEPNYLCSIDAATSSVVTPNDPSFGDQWALQNTGQMYPYSGVDNAPPGLPGCDISTPQAWARQQG